MLCCIVATEIPDDPYIESTGYWQDISVDQSDDDVWKTTDMGWGVYPEGMRKMLNYIQVGYCWGLGALGLLGLVGRALGSNTSSMPTAERPVAHAAATAGRSMVLL